MNPSSNFSWASIISKTSFGIESGEFILIPNIRIVFSGENMNLQEFFAISDSSYDEVHNRISSDTLLKKFLRQFLEDSTFESLEKAMDKKDYKNAFFASHSLKGVCSNLGLTKLEKDTIVLLEYLRTNSENPDIDEAFCNDSFTKIKKDYEQVISAIKILEN